MTAAAPGANVLSARRTVAVAVAVNCITVVPLLLTGAVAPQIRGDLGFDEAALGLLFALFSVGGLVASPIVGLVVDRAGPSRGLRLSAALTAVALLAIAFSADWWMLAVVMLVGGVASGISPPAGNLWIVRAVPHERQGLAFGIKQSASPAASVLSGLAVPAIALTVGWRWAFVAAAVLAITIFMGVPRLPDAGGRTGPRRRGAVGPRAPLIVLTAGVTLGFLSNSALTGFYVTNAVGTGIGEGTAGVLLALGSLIGVITRLVAGAVADRKRRGYLRAVSVMYAIGACCYGVMALGNAGLLVAVTPLVFASAAGWTGLLHLAVVHSHPGAAATATGILMFGAYGGTVVGPILFGALVERSYAASWLMCAATMLVGAMVVRVATPMLRARVVPRPTPAVIGGES